jgi:hypothetical protein
MKFHPHSIIVCIDQAKCVASIPVHMPVRFGNAPFTHRNGNLSAIKKDLTDGDNFLTFLYASNKDREIIKRSLAGIR